MSTRRFGSTGWWRGAAVLAAMGAAVAGAPPRASGAAVPSLGAARNFAVLAGTSVTNTGASAVTGDVGVSPGASITGFPPGLVSGGSLHAADGPAAAAQADAALAYGLLAGMAYPVENDLTGTDLGGLTLTPGVYHFDTSAQLTGTLTLEAGCDPGALFVFQMGSTLTTAAASSVVVVGGGGYYDVSNTHWQVGSSATVGSGTGFTGNILALTSITIESGATMDGNALALTGTVTLDANVVTTPPLPPEPGSLILSQYWGHVTDAKDAGRDSTQIRATYVYSGSPDGTLLPAIEGMTIALGPFGEAAPLALVIPPLHAGWKYKSPYWNWAGTVGGVKWTVRVDDTARRIIVHVANFTLDPGDGLAGLWGGDNESFGSSLTITCGNDSGWESTCFRNSKTFNHTRNWGVLRIP